MEENEAKSEEVLALLMEWVTEQKKRVWDLVNDDAIWTSKIEHIIFKRGGKKGKKKGKEHNNLFFDL